MTENYVNEETFKQSEKANDIRFEALEKVLDASISTLNKNMESINKTLEKIMEELKHINENKVSEKEVNNIVDCHFNKCKELWEAIIINVIEKLEAKKALELQKEFKKNFRNQIITWIIGLLIAYFTLIYQNTNKMNELIKNAEKKLDTKISEIITPSAYDD